MTADAAAAPEGEDLRIAVVGHVDHGKSTLVGRLLHAAGCFPDGKEEAIRAMCRRRGMPFEWAFALDALQVERDQGITIDASHAWLRAGGRRLVFVDAPGHGELVRNMITGAADCDAALLVIDAKEGMREQSRRHGYLLHLLGVRQVVVAVNKMDLAGYDGERFARIERDCRAYLGRLGVAPAAIVPVSARGGDNVASRSARMAWHDGPTVLECLDLLRAAPPLAGLPLRFPVQDVYRFDERRILAGRIEAGTLRVGDEILFSPSNKTARIASIEAWGAGAAPLEARAGRSIGITLDEQVVVERGEIASHEDDPPVETDVFRAHLFWLGRRPLAPEARCLLRLGTAEIPARVQSIDHVVDTGDLGERPAGEIGRGAVARATLRADRLVALDPFSACPPTGRFVLVEDRVVAGGGVVSMDGYVDRRSIVAVRATNIARVARDVSPGARAERNRHKAGVLWLTGLSGAGKSTLAVEAERRLFGLGYQVCALDGDNLRHGLNADLGFAPADRVENVRRIGEVASLMAEAGMVVLAASISPYRSDRDRLRAAIPGFHEIHVKAGLDVCEARDPKGLYRRARAGEIADFTGVSAPYEPPPAPELVVDTAGNDVDACVGMIVEYARRGFAPDDA